VNLQNSEIYISIFLASLVVSSSLIPILRMIAFKFGILDKPNQGHKTHHESIPYLGGFAIIIPIVFLAIIGYIFFLKFSDFGYRLLLTLVPSLLLSIVGLYDDMKNLSARFRFIFQSLVATLSAALLIQLDFGVKISEIQIISSCITILWIVGITNAFNLFDNLDGGAAGITLISSSTIFILAITGKQFLISCMSIGLAGAALGFLFWNRNPAKIYLGDSGALFIGFFLALLLIQFEPSIESPLASLALPVFILALPIIDTTVVVASRLSRGVSLFQGGRDHLSHRLLLFGFSRKETALLLWGLATLFSSLTLLMSVSSSEFSLFICILTLLLMIYLIFRFLRLDTKL